jgi:alpha-L-fucosidase
MSAGYSGNKGVGDYGTPEQNIPANGFPKGVYWESCMTMNDTWGYVAVDQNWKTATKLIQNLADCASKGGNYLLNVGPTGEGEIPAESLVRLAEIGKWMNVNGEAIKQTQGGPFTKPFSWGRITQRGNDVYLIIFERPANGRIVLPLDNKPVAAKFLDPSTLQPVIQIDREGIVVALPSEMPNRHASVVKLTLDAPAKARDGSGGVRSASGQPIKAKDGKVSLLPEDATLTDGLVTESKDAEKTNIGHWTNASGSATWTFSAPKGTYHVALEVANPGAGNTLTLNFGGDKILKVAVPSTGDWAKFKRVVAGQIELSESTTLKVTCEKIVGEGAANVRSIQLEKR